MKILQNLLQTHPIKESIHKFNLISPKTKKTGALRADSLGNRRKTESLQKGTAALWLFRGGELLQLWRRKWLSLHLRGL